MWSGKSGAVPGRLASWALVASLSTACVSHVRFRPIGDEWEPRDGGARDYGSAAWMILVPVAFIGGVPRGASALEVSGAAVVEVDLDAESNEFPLAGEVRNHGTEVLRVAFSPEKGASDDAVVARISGTGEPVSLRAGESFDLFPPGGEGPSWRRFALRPDESWPESKLPHLGATVSYVAIVQASTGETRVPLRFRVVTAYRNIAGWGEPQWDRLPCFMHPWFGRDPEPEKTQ